MKKFCVFLFGAAIALPLYAQDASTTDPAPAADAAPAEAPADAPADAAAPDAAATEAAPADASSAPADAAAAEPAVEETPRAPLHFYVGAAQDTVHASFSEPRLMTRFGGQDFSTQMYHVRAGIRLFDVVGVELQLGKQDDKGTRPGRVSMDGYKGIFLVPTGHLFDLFELSALIGYSRFDLKKGAAREKFAGTAYGLNAEFPIKVLWESLPDFRLGGGYRIYSAENQARVYGFHIGLRFDFQI